MTEIQLRELAIAGIRAEIARLEALLGQLTKRRGGRPRKDAAPLAPTGPKKRTMSAASRKKISAAQKKRWAAQKAGAQK